MKKLEPCPFCGGGAKFVDMGGDRLFIECEDCDAQFGEVWATDTRDRLELLWNKREAREMKNDLCANDGYIPVARSTDNFERGKFLWYIECVQCGQRTKLYKSEKKATRKWNKQQRQAKLESKEPELEHDIVVKMQPKESTLYTLITPDEHRRILADNAQQLVELCKLRDEKKQLKSYIAQLEKYYKEHSEKIQQLRQRVQQLESERDQPIVDVAQVLKENEQLRQQIQQLETREEELKQCTIKIGRWNLEHGNAIEVVEHLIITNDQLLAYSTQLMKANEQLRESRHQVVEQLSQAVEFAEQTAMIVSQVVKELGKRE